MISRRAVVQTATIGTSSLIAGRTVLPATISQVGGTPAASPEASPAASPAADTVERSATRITGFKNPELDFQLMRSLGAGIYGGGTPGEIFAARASIGEDPYAWPPAFDQIATAADAEAAKTLEDGFPVSAREASLRASMYWRASEYFSDPLQEEGVTRGRASRASFLQAASLLPHSIEAIEIPFENTNLPGYVMRPAGDANGITLLVLTGFDGTGEELYFETAAAGLERGFTIVIAEGPGQVGAMRDNPNLVFRPDYEVPIAAMIDAAFAQVDVDPARFGIYGISLGGYFTIRGAEHDDRIKALIVNSPIPNLRRYQLGFLGGEHAATQIPDISLDEIDEIPDDVISRTEKLSLKASMRRFGVDSLHGWISKLEAFDATPDLGNITVPSLAMVGTGEGKEARDQFDEFVKGVAGPVTQRIFTQAEGADMHCQFGNLSLSNSVIYDWLQTTLG